MNTAMHRLIAAVAVSAAMLTPASLAAKGKVVDELVEITAKAPVTLRADRAYFLFRTNSKGITPVFLRKPSAAEIDAYFAAKAEAYAKAEAGLIKARDAALAKQRAAAAKGTPFKGVIPPVPTLANFTYDYPDVHNVQTVNLGKALVKGETERLMLIEALPGDYVIYGMGWGPSLTTCLCLGTLGFTAKAGEVTDLGKIYIAAAAVESEDPVLRNVTGLGYSVNGHMALFSMVLAPLADDMSQTPLIDKARIKPADYHAVGKFVAPSAFNINRLAPVPGLLDYRRGDVIDGRTGQVVVNNY